jgi:hypothetical protein
LALHSGCSRCRRVWIAKAAHENTAQRNKMMRDWWDVVEFLINLALILALTALAVLVYVEIAHG